MADVLPFPDHPQDDYPLIKSGTYALKFTGWETKRMFNTGKVSLWFQVVDYGESFGVRLARHYNAQKLKGKTGKKGGFVVGKCSSLAREVFDVLERAGHNMHGVRLDRLRLSLLEAHIITGKVKTVTHDSKRKPIPASLQYSVIEELTGISPP
jgi:hypothetical protein